MMGYGRRFTIKTNNQPIFGGGGRWNNRGRVGGAGHVGEVLYHPLKDKILIWQNILYRVLDMSTQYNILYHTTQYIG